MWLRQIQQGRWYRHGDVSWLRHGAVQADALRDLQTLNSRLSMWWIEDDRNNLNRVMAAMASRWEHVKHFDYALLPESVVADLGIKYEHCPGETHDKDANEWWHWDFIELTVDKLNGLAHAVADSDNVIDREPRPLLVTHLATSVANSYLDLSALHPSVKKKLPT